MRSHFASHLNEPLTLGHGDAHIANSVINERGAGFLDWQLRRSPWYQDVCFFIVSALDIADRRHWEQRRLKTYLKNLEEQGVVPPAFDRAFLSYRREIIFGYIIFFTNGTQYWTEAETCAAMARFGMAAKDLDLLEAIES